jgi:hypothetical protein
MLCAAPRETAQAQVPVSGTIVVDTTQSTQPPWSSTTTRLTSSFGSVEISASASKATGQAGVVKLRVKRTSTLLNGYVKIAGILSCGGNNQNITFTQIRPSVTRPWERELTCTNTGSPVVFLADLALLPN